MDTPEYEKMFVCTCYGDGILVRRFDDIPLTFISFWTTANRRFSLWTRLRFAWNMLRWGVSADEVVFDEASCEALAKALSQPSSSWMKK